MSFGLGSTVANTGTGSVFGKPLFNASTTTAQQTQQQPQQMGASIFGNTMAQPQQAQAQQPGLPSLSQSQAQLTNSLWQPSREAPHQRPVQDQIMQVLEKWDTTNPNCVFQHYFYNRVEEANVPFYKPGPHENPREWEEALQKKPAPGFIPVLCTGFQGISERLKTQRRAVADLNTRIHQINSSLDAILSRHDLATSVRAAAARRRHVVLQERCMSFAAKVQVLRNRGYALSGEEDDMRLKLHALETAVNDPAMSAKEEELWSRLIVLRGYATSLSQELNKPMSQADESLDEETELKLKKVLEDYDKQLQHLKKEVESIKAQYEVMQRGVE
ncbi:Nucleoporin NUP57 [Ceratocystis fimbriata CBS 114723]|uniref:Nucleoporin NUP57 n=1 Tax=Ceratocystis fimbriata CBS 114723 TaxID=1035309 RepID=A0A2C5WSN7_9PEZI|nr:Nucleoporin NUP57 [Ceratocystis fimbriata CBS 114723]